MLEPIKFLFILTGASTYLVTKYIKVGLDDTNRSANHSGTFHNNSQWNEHYRNRSTNSIARLSQNISSQHFGYTIAKNVGASGNNQSGVGVGGSFNNSRSHSSNRFYHNNQASNIGNKNGSNNSSYNPSYHIALIATPSSSTSQIDATLRNSTHSVQQHHKQTVFDRSELLHYRSNSEDSGGSGDQKNGVDTDSTTTPPDNRPTFVIEINEEDDRNLPKLLLQISLNSDDDNVQQVPDVSYTIDGDGIDDAIEPSDQKFAINTTTGEIFVRKPLDRDRPLGKPRWKMNAYAKSISTTATQYREPRILGYADIVVNLRDINDNYPQFTKSVYLASVPENSTARQYVTQVEAIDADDHEQGENARVRYAIEQNQVSDRLGGVIFTIDELTGEIRTAVCCLDREQRDNYTIVVSATDGGGLKSSALVAIKLLDINDESPRFIKKEWQIEIEENDSEMVLVSTSPDNETANPGTSAIAATSIPILRLSVHDDDLPETNEFQYKIINERHLRHFEKLRDDDFATDPTELRANYSQNFVIVAESADGSASLRLLRPLDYERAADRFIILKIAVSDRLGENDAFADPTHFDICFVYIKVRDTNDNKPEFAQTLVNVSLPENAQLGTIITKFYATDADQNGHAPVLYNLDGETNRRRYFSIDSEGLVRLNRALDREITPTHIVKVIACDTDEPRMTSTATLVVNIEDINDNAPVLTSYSLPPILENSPPGKVGDLFAVDADDYSKGNGPPFTFFLASDAPEQIKRSFRLESDFKGEGKATLYSMISFDREMQKEYILPVVVRDRGYPALSSTCMLTVTVGDLNDNDMRENGWKEITVFYINLHDILPNMQNLQKPIEIGRVNVDDPDDWDIADKTFFWNEDVIDGKFYLDSRTGMVTLKAGDLANGKHELKFAVFDKRYQHRVHSSMQVTIQDIPFAAIINSGSLRIEALDSFHFIAIWDWKTRRRVTSIKERLQESLRLIIGCDIVEIFSIAERITNSSKVLSRKMLDVRYFAKSKGRFLSAVYLNSIVQLHGDLLEQQLSLKVTQIGINECMSEEHHQCESASCFTDVTIDWTNPSQLVQGNFTAFSGIRLLTEAKCTCYYDNLLSHFDHKFICDIDQTLCSTATSSFSPSLSYSSSFLDISDRCHLQDKVNAFTQNYRTSISNLNFNCVNGNRHVSSNANSRSFKGNGWLWLDPLPLCRNNILSLHIATTEPNGIILYYGPLVRSNRYSNDFILLELLNGKIRLLFDFGSGIDELSIESDAELLTDGNWHRIDVQFDTNRVRLILDTCRQSAQSRFGGLEVELDKCINSTDIPSFSESLNVNGPLQIGGIHHSGTVTSSSYASLLETLNPDILARYRSPSERSSITGFVGCISKLAFNSHIYDLIEAHHFHNSQTGCYSANAMCSLLNKKCHNNGVCEGNYNRVNCACQPGYYGSDCSLRSDPVMFDARSFIHLSLFVQRQPLPYAGHYTPAAVKQSTMDGNPLSVSQNVQFTSGFHTKIEFTFRTRQTQAEIVRLEGKNANMYCLMEIRNARITFRFNLDPSATKSGRRERGERILSLESFAVNDGKWHHVEALRFGQSAILTLDSGGVGKSTQLIADDLSISMRRTNHVFEMNPHQVIIGGQVHYLAIGSTAVTNDFADGCLNDLKINDVHIVLSNLLRASMDDYAVDSVAKMRTTPANDRRLHPDGADRSGNGFMQTLQQDTATATSATMTTGTKKVGASSAITIASTISITKWQNVRVGCKPTRNPCVGMHCGKSRICVDEWLLAKCRCPNGYSENGHNCSKTSQLCKVNPCLCRGQWRKTETERSVGGSKNNSATLSRLFSSASSSGNNQTNCENLEQDQQPITVNARVFQLEYGLFVVVLIALVPLNIPFIIYIGFICCRNKRRRQQRDNSQRQTRPTSGNGNFVGDKVTSTNNTATSAAPNDDIRENIICYRDEGGGEDDVRAYDLVALRIQIPNAMMMMINDTPSNKNEHCNSNNVGDNNNNNNFMIGHESNRFHDNDDKPASSSVNFDTWQELTVI